MEDERLYIPSKIAALRAYLCVVKVTHRFKLGISMSPPFFFWLIDGGLLTNMVVVVNHSAQCTNQPITLINLYDSV